jgi:FkbM family methyltransferase
MGIKSCYVVCLAKISSVLSRTPFVRSKLILRMQKALLSICCRDNTVSIGDFVFRIHSDGEFIAKKLILFKGYEKEEISYICSIVKHGDTVVDVGANIGLYTVYLSRAVGATGTVLCFEPDPANLELLEDNIKLNSCENVKVFPFALGSAASTQKLYLCDENKGYQSLADLAHTGKYIEIAVEKASDALKGYQPSVMKIDVEGAEPLVWEGMDEPPPYILFEFVPSQIRALDNDPLLFLETLVAEGYRLRVFDNGKLVGTTPQEMTSLADRTGKDYNIVAEFAGGSEAVSTVKALVGGND